MDLSLLSRPGAALFTGGGWLRRHHMRQEHGALLLTEPVRVLTARTPEEVPAVLEQIEAAQARGDYVAGYMAYEAGAAFGLKAKTPDPVLPLAWMAVYSPEAARYLSPYEQAGLFEAVDTSRIARMLAAIEPKLSVSKPEFVRALERIHQLIASGETYQVNYTVRARFDLSIEPLDYFLAMLVRQPVPYAAFLDLGDTHILSLSPELLLRRKDRLLESAPMKGTRPRAEDPREDAALAVELLSSEKDRAENIMIVDMMRNDLGRISRAGTVQVPALFSVEPYRTVWQMASTVTGQIRQDATPGEILAATFPGASITGAPKHRTMEIIAELETEPRGVYTGTVALFLPGGDFTCNVAIRTLTHRRSAFLLGVGAGIVWDSDPEEEYEETLTKATFALPRATGSDGPAARAGARPRWRPASPAERVRAHSIGLFETLVLETSGESNRNIGGSANTLRGYRDLDRHLDRMAASAHFLEIAFDREAAETLLTESADDPAELAGPADPADGPATDSACLNHPAIIIRLDLSPEGRLRLAFRPMPQPPTGPVSLLVSPFRTDPHEPLLAHKTTARHLYDRERTRAQAGGHGEALFLNGLGHVTEGAVTNIFLRRGASWATPPVADGLLPGIWRDGFLREREAEERTLTLDDLLSADEIVIGNSVRGAVQVSTLVVNRHGY